MQRYGAEASTQDTGRSVIRCSRRLPSLMTICAALLLTQCGEGAYDGPRVCESGVCTEAEACDVDAIQIQSPLMDERFVRGETVSFAAALTGEHPCEGSALVWTSSVDGAIGTGANISVDTLSTGRHQVTVSGYGSTTTAPVRVFSDLGTFYQAMPADGEIARGRLESREPRAERETHARLGNDRDGRTEIRVDGVDTGFGQKKLEERCRGGRLDVHADLEGHRALRSHDDVRERNEEPVGGAHGIDRSDLLAISLWTSRLFAALSVSPWH